MIRSLSYSLKPTIVYRPSVTYLFVSPVPVLSRKPSGLITFVKTQMEGETLSVPLLIFGMLSTVFLGCVETKKNR